MISKFSEYGESGTRLHLQLVSLLLPFAFSPHIRLDRIRCPGESSVGEFTMGGWKEEDGDVGFECGRQRGRGSSKVGF